MSKIKPLTRALAVVIAFAAFAVQAQTSQNSDSGLSARIQRAQSLYDRGQSADALALVEQIREDVPADPEARFLQGLIFADMGRNEDAIEVFASLTSDYPELPEPWNNLAVLFAENGDFDKARQALLAAIQTHPSYSTAHENLGDLYARMAGMAYDRALEQDRGNESARLKLSAVNGLFSVPTPEPAGTMVAAAEPTPRATAPAPAATTRPAPEPARTVEPTPARTPAPQPRPQVAAVTTTPEPQPVRADASAEIEATVRRWASAWAGQDVEGYLNTYSSSFRPANGASRASWVRYRRDRLSAPGFIRVDVTNFSIDVRGERNAVATFDQRYRSDNYEDNVRKTLTMELTSSGWQIVSEVSDSG